MIQPAAAALAGVSFSDRELVVRRVIAAPRERVFQAWVGQFPLWWGPRGMTTPYCEMDLRPGGIFRTVLRAPNGAEYPTRGVFLEVTENERIVFTDAFDPGWDPSDGIFFTAIVTFDPLPRHQTCCTARARHWTEADCRRHAHMGFHVGWGESFDRLDALVRQPGPAGVT